MSHVTLDVTQLFEAVKQIHLKYSPLLESKEHSFNIFSILRPEHDEVNLHSRFLFELLDPQGTHQQKDAFLALFLRQLNLPTDFHLENLYVGREEDDIDILIHNRSQAIIVENKIYAGDQPSQLQRYYKQLERRGFKQIWIIYLTLDGYGPSPDSIGNLDRRLIKTISYAVEIDSWLDNCLQITKNIPSIQEVLAQYKALIKKLTGQSQLEEYIMEIKDFLLQSNNFQLALDIDEAVDEIMVETQLRFWHEFEEALRARGYQVLEDSKYSRQKVENFYLGGRNRHFYGLMLNLDKFSLQEQLYFYIEIYNKLYYGFISKANNSTTTQKAKFDNLVGLISNLDKKFRRSGWWVGQKFPECCNIDFDNFHEPDTASLVQPEERAALVSKLADEVDILLKRFFNEFKR